MKASELTKAFKKLDAEKAEELVKKMAAAEKSGDGDDVDDALEAVSDALDAHGVEGARKDGAHVDKYWRDTILCYVNMGDTYDTTVCYDTENGEFFVGSWGDFIEKRETEEEDEDEDEDTSSLEEDDGGDEDEDGGEEE